MSPSFVPVGFVPGSSHRQPSPVAGGAGSPDFVVNPAPVVPAGLSEKFPRPGPAMLVEHKELNIEVFTERSIAGVSGK